MVYNKKTGSTEKYSVRENSSTANSGYGSLAGMILYIKKQKMSCSHKIETTNTEGTLSSENVGITGVSKVRLTCTDAPASYKLEVTAGRKSLLVICNIVQAIARK